MFYIILIAILVIVDQLSKYLVAENMYLGESIPIINNFFHITYVENRGIAFGMFQGKLDIISIATILAIVAIAGYLYKSLNKLPYLEKIGYIYIFSGAIGNMIDRVFRNYVIDMIDFRGIWSYVFNFADVWINLGVAFILLNQIVFSKKKDEVEK